MNREIDGFYAAYLSAKERQGFALFVFRNGQIVGADAGGVCYDGRYGEKKDDVYQVTLVAKIPPNKSTIHGSVTGPNGEVNELDISLPYDFLTRDFIRVEGRHGPVNAKLVRLRGIDD